MELSIIIPTCRRLETLRRVLSVLQAQISEMGVEAEIRVTDDGSGDGTASFLEAFAGQSSGLLRFRVHETNRGPAAARNTALKEASGRLILITGDDIIPEPGFLRNHLAWHGRHPEERDAVLGKVTWPTDMETTPFMRWMEKGGRKYFFDFPALPSGHEIPPAYFYTANVSLKRSLLLKAGPFDESFPFASHEDLEMGARLGVAGMRLYYESGLLASHWHRLTVGGLIRRTYLQGYSAVLYWRKVPDPAPNWKKRMRTVLAALCGAKPSLALWKGLVRCCGRVNGGPAIWWPTLAASYWVGFSDARRDFPARTPEE